MYNNINGALHFTIFCEEMFIHLLMIVYLFMNLLPVDLALPVHKSWALGWTLDLHGGGFVWSPVPLNRPHLLSPAQSTWQLSPLGLPSPVRSSSLCHPTCLIYNISLWEYSSMRFLLAFSGIVQCFVMGSNLCCMFHFFSFYIIVCYTSYL